MSLNYNPITKIKVFGVGGAGCNVVNAMVEDGMQGATFYAINTDAQVLSECAVENLILIGPTTTGGRGAGADPKVGLQAAVESQEELKEAVKDADMIFIACGMGGGTGTGAGPFLAELAKATGALTVGVVTKPFEYEGYKKNRIAVAGIEKMKEFVDALIIVSNDRLAKTWGGQSLLAALKEADNVLRQSIQAITDLVGVKAKINLDFADVRTVMQNQGSALIGVGISSPDNDGSNRAIEAAKNALDAPLLEANSIRGARKAIINVTGGTGMTLNEYQQAIEHITKEATCEGNEIEIIAGLAINERLGNQIVVTVIATGFIDDKQNMAEGPGDNIATPTKAVFQREEEELTFPEFFTNR